MEPPWRGTGTCCRWLLLVVFLVGALLLYCVDPYNVRLSRLYQLHRENDDTPPVHSLSPSAFLVDTPGCRIPLLEPMDEAVRRFVFPVKPVHCGGAPLVESGRTHLRIRWDRTQAYNISDPSRLTCCARPFWRPEPPPKPVQFQGIDDAIQFAENCTSFTNELEVFDEFLRVDCYDDDVHVYKDIFGFTPEKTKTVMSSENLIEDVVDPDTPKVSVLIVGIDSVSRSNLLRQMPKTVQILRDLKAIDLMGYNKVEDNTFPNLLAVLTGLTIHELRIKCWPATSQPFDKCPFIWKRFQLLGYRTAYGEDEPWMGIFNYLKNGFARQPVDYYMRPYARLLFKELGHHAPATCKLCVGRRFQLATLLDYAERFARLSGNLFGLFWGVSMSHDLLNLPQLADPLYEKFLRRLREHNVLNKTVLIFMSDHGIRWGDIRETYQGRMEERLPFFMMVLPEWLKERYPSAVANLRRNSRRLTTPFDVHSTLQDLLDLYQLDQTVIRARAAHLMTAPKLPRAVSLFLNAPETRTCGDAGLVPHWCTCHASTPVPTNDSVTVRAALFIVKKVNNLLSGFMQCAKLQLDTIVDARREEGHAEGVGGAKKHVVQDYTLLLSTKPGGARLEATVRFRPDKNHLELAGTVSRVNRYGTQSACVADYFIRLYCFCT